MKIKKNNKNIKIEKAIDFDEMLAEELKNKTFKRYFDEHGKQLEVAYALLQLRKSKKMSQAQLAKKIGTTQSNVARFESGNQNLTITFLTRIAAVLGKEVKITLE